MPPLSIDPAAPFFIVFNAGTGHDDAAQTRAVRAFVGALGVPTVLEIPGNHDIPLFNLAARLWRPCPNHCAAIGADPAPQFESPGLLVLTVNPTRALRHQDGAVSTAQVARVAQRLARAGSGRLGIVATHPPVTVQRTQDTAATGAFERCATDEVHADAG